MIAFYLLTLFGLLIYSFSQIDLNLTLLQAPWFLAFQSAMIQLGYFHRPLSTGIFLVLLILLSTFYFLLYRRANSNRLAGRNIAFLLGGLAILGLFSYPAFSHDLFNSIFYPRIIIEHSANPYGVTALTFPADTWTRFMQWTHNTYQWGPVYLAISIPFYLLGLGKFVLTLLSFKMMGALAFLGSCYLINKTASRSGLIFFALNPLIILEAVVAGHLDIIMLFFALAAIRFASLHQKLSSYVFLFLSVGTKFTTVAFLPVFVLWKKMTEAKRQSVLIILAFLGSLFQVYVRDLLPHYFIVPIGIVAIYPHHKKLVTATAVISVSLLLIRYIPFLLFGTWWQIRL